MSIHETVVGLLGLLLVFYGEMREKVAATIRDLPQDDGERKPSRRDLRFMVPASYIKSTSIPRGKLLQKLLRSMVIRRGNDDTDETICGKS